MLNFDANKYAKGLTRVDFDGIILTDGENEVDETQLKTLKARSDYPALVKEGVIKVGSEKESEPLVPVVSATPAKVPSVKV
jgi:hypothetical protein